MSKQTTAQKMEFTHSDGDGSVIIRITTQSGEVIIENVSLAQAVLTLESLRQAILDEAEQERF